MSKRKTRIAPDEERKYRQRLAKLADKNKLRIRRLSDYCMRLMRNGAALVDVWPNQRKFRVVRSEEKARVGSPGDAIELALDVFYGRRRKTKIERHLRPSEMKLVNEAIHALVNYASSLDKKQLSAAAHTIMVLRACEAASQLPEDPDGDDGRPDEDDDRPEPEEDSYEYEDEDEDEFTDGDHNESYYDYD